MKLKSFLLIVLTSICFLISCKKDSTTGIQFNFTNNLAYGTADSNGDYTITGHITSSVRLDSVTLIKQGQSSPFLTDVATAKNKTDYTFSYLVTGITANTTILIDVFDQNGGKIESTFLINK
ncbi:MAG: hypothetical protein KGM16_06945 [Bacteroidota bacterium]|nr:hypothetical protein [Bacteroidota bacterium]